MARTARIKKTGNGTVYYHLMSRTNDRKFLFDRGRVKEDSRGDRPRVWCRRFN